MTLNVQRDGDDELWIVSSKLDDGFQWSIPIVTKPHLTTDDPPERWAYVHGSNYGWSARQFEELSLVLDRHDCVPADPRGWWFRQAILEKFATKAPGINSDFYIRWPGYETPSYSDIDTLDLPEEPEFNRDELKFLKHLQRTTGTQSWEAIKFLWLSFRKQAVLWMAVERKPLDLGFIRLMPMPYRANWKEAIAVRFGSLFHLLRRPLPAPAGDSEDPRTETLQAAGFFAALASVKLLAVGREKPFCRWTVESLPSAGLMNAMDEQEYRKFQRIGPASYAVHILRAMAARLSDTMKIMRHYTEALWSPPGRRVEGPKGFGVEIIAPDLRDGRIRSGRGIVEELQIFPGAFERLTDTEESRPEPVKPQKIPEFLKNVQAFKQIPESVEESNVK